MAGRWLKGRRAVVRGCECAAMRGSDGGKQRLHAPALTCRCCHHPAGSPAGRPRPGCNEGCCCSRRHRLQGQRRSVGAGSARQQSWSLAYSLWRAAPSGVPPACATRQQAPCSPPPPTKWPPWKDPMPPSMPCTAACWRRICGTRRRGGRRLVTPAALARQRCTRLWGAAAGRRAGGTAVGWPPGTRLRHARHFAALG